MPALINEVMRRLPLTESEVKAALGNDGHATMALLGLYSRGEVSINRAMVHPQHPRLPLEEKS